MTGNLGTPTWGEITGAVGLALGGDRDAGAMALAQCWARTGDADHARRCVLAHYLADLESDLADEIAWDERALAAYAHVDDEDLTVIGIPHAGGMAPSLHLNLGDGYLRAGRMDEARAQLAAGVAQVEVLGADGYGAMIRQGLERLAARIDAGSESRRR